MDGRRFDALARHLAAAGTSRRRFLRTLGGGLVASIGVASSTGGAGAVICRAGGVLCAKDAQCCSGTCNADTHRCACEDGEILCRNRCIPACSAVDECHVAGDCDPSTGACTNPPADSGTTCGQGPRCVDGVANEQDMCNGDGTCTTGAETDCKLYRCGATSCLTSCDDVSACVDDAYCADHQCFAKLDKGSTCNAAEQCLSGFCVDEVCCDSGCTDPCQTCSTGTCSGCPASQTCLGGVSCGCPDGYTQLANGTCVTETCAGGCNAYSDTSGSYYCSNGDCPLNPANSSCDWGCTSDTGCQTGTFCHPAGNCIYAC